MPLHLLVPAAARGQDQHRRRRCRPRASARSSGQPVEPGQAEVEHHRVVASVCARNSARLAVGRAVHGVAGVAQRGGQSAGERPHLRPPGRAREPPSRPGVCRLRPEPPLNAAFRVGSPGSDYALRMITLRGHEELREAGGHIRTPSAASTWTSRRRNRGHRRQVGQRQIDAPEPDGRHRPPHAPAASSWRGARSTLWADALARWRGEQRRHRLPVLPVAADADVRRKRHAADGLPRPTSPRRGGASVRSTCSIASAWPTRPTSCRRALRRPAAARGDRARTGQRTRQ